MDQSFETIKPEILQASVAREHGVPVESVTLSDVSIKAGSKKGDGFMCLIAAIDFEATVEGQKLKKSYIAKYAPDGHRAAMLQQMESFNNEGDCYLWMIPKLQKMRAERNLKPLAFPKCFYASSEESILILENMKAQDFDVIPKKMEPLTLGAVKLVLHELAAFHATSHHFIKTYPGGLTSLAVECPRIFEAGKTFFKSKDGSDDMLKKILHMTQQMFDSCLLVVQKFGSEELTKRMESFQPKVSEVMTDFFIPTNIIDVVTHGDAWYNNFLYKHQNGMQADPTHLAIVDLQGTRLGRPPMELAYFLCSSTSPNQRRLHFDELIRFYHDRFTQELKDLGSDFKAPFSLDELKKEYNECFKYGFVMGCGQAQALLGSKSSEVNFDLDTFSDEEATRKMYDTMRSTFLKNVEESPDFREIVFGLVQEAVDRNVL